MTDEMQPIHNSVASVRVVIKDKGENKGCNNIERFQVSLVEELL